MKKLQSYLCLLIVLMFFGAHADPKTDAIHNELRAMRAVLMDAINKGDIERELTYLTTNVVVTWHNAEVSRGREGVRDYYNRMMRGPNPVVSDFSAEVNVDALTTLYGDNMGIAYGSSVEHFKLTNGKKFDLKGRWSTTMVKQDGRWLIASLHASTNIFDNVMLDTVKDYAAWAAIATLVIGIVVGWLIGRRANRTKATTTV